MKSSTKLPPGLINLPGVGGGQAAFVFPPPAFQTPPSAPSRGASGNLFVRSIPEARATGPGWRVFGVNDSVFFLNVLSDSRKNKSEDNENKLKC